MALEHFVGPWPLFSILIIYTVGRTPWTGDQPITKPLPTHRTTNRYIEQMHTDNRSRVKFEPTIPVFEEERTVHALHPAATVIDRS
jgi:hypothetical protein